MVRPMEYKPCMYIQNKVGRVGVRSTLNVALVNSGATPLVALVSNFHHHQHTVVGCLVWIC